ncbi:MAG: cell division topological specificity factor MinE [Bacillota bacterium]|nr:cell division topological specificity factor MinE [Clostridia bacterium]
MGDFISRFFGKDSGNSKNVAKERLRLVLVHDRANVSPEILEKLREDLIEVINKYMEIDQTALEVSLNSSVDDSIALVANIPILGIRRHAL